MPGVIRPYTLVDVLGTLNQQSTQNAGSFTGLATFGEADETLGAIDSVTATLNTTPATWDNGAWGQFTWG
jgi:hypothetical protein